jgi:hypothetical protein
MDECLTSRADEAGADPHQGPTLSVVIPALNEESGIIGILNGILSKRKDLEAVGIADLELIVVDDGSRDATAEIAEGVPGVRVVRHDVNRGYGAAIKTGFRHATGELLAFLDADSTYPPEFLAGLCEVALKGGADIVIGSRRSGAESNMPRIRRLGNLIWSSLLTVLGNTKVEDPASGMRVLWRHCLTELYPLPDGLNFTPVMSARAVHERLTVVERPIRYCERSGRSKLSVIRDGLRFLATIVWTVLEYNPARVLELGGTAALGVSAAIGLSLLGARLNGITELHTWGVLAVYLSLVLAVGGVSAFALGVAFNHLVALFHHRPIQQTHLAACIVRGPLEHHFGWITLILIALGTGVGACSIALALQGWEMTRLWLWLLGSALFLLSGLQLALFSMFIRVLDGLNQREERIGRDLYGGEIYAPVLEAAKRAAIG